MPARIALLCVAVGVIVTAVVAASPRAWQQLRPGLPGAEQAEPPAVGTGAVSGVVTDGVTGRPIAGALVSLAGGGRGGPGALPRQMTDARGRFIFTRLPAFENYTLSATKDGYFVGRYKETPGINATVRLELADGQWFQEADVTLWRPAAISGIVRDERGEPLVGVPVRALATVPIAGRERWASGPAATTDDRGMYRLSGLRPGAYVVQVPSVQLTLPGAEAAARTVPPPAAMGSTGPATPRTEPLTMRRLEDGYGLLVGHFPTPLPGSGATAYPMAFHPASRTLDGAARVAIGYGEERTNVDVQLELVPTVRVSGLVTGAPDVVAGVPVRIVPAGAEDLGPGGEVALTMTDEAGAFVFHRVPAGDYLVVASSTQSSYSIGVTGSAVASAVMPERASLFSGSMSSGSLAGSDDLRYTTRSGRGTGAFGKLSLAVGAEDVDGLAIPLRGGVVVSGHYVWDGSPDPPAGVPRGPLLRLEPADGDLSVGIPLGGMTRPTARPGDAAASAGPMTFEIDRVLPGRYVFGAPLVSGYTVEAVELGARNLLHTPLDVDGSEDITGIVVRLTSRTMSLTGYVRDSTGAPANSGAVLFFPADRAGWQDYGLRPTRFGTSTITSQGSYRAPALVPGEYLLAAVTDEERQLWTDAAFLQTLVARATRVTLAPGVNLTVDLTRQGGR